MRHPGKVSLVLLILPALFFRQALGDDATGDLPRKAIDRSQITAPGSRPFYLKAEVSESTNPANQEYRAEIEETWVAPDKWRRTVKSPGFSQTLIVSGEKSSEQSTGDYYPNWLRTIVAAMFTPGDALQGIDMSRSSDNPMIGGTKTCRRFTYMAGVSPVSNKVFSTVCFENGLLESIDSPGYSARYSDYRGFAGKRVARKIGEYIEPGTELEAKIEDLKELNGPDDSQFSIQQPNIPLQTVRIGEATFRGLIINSPEIAWPTIRGGSDTGTLSLYVCLDRAGRVREIYELNSSNPGLSDFARDQVMKWQFKTAASHGNPVQLEALLTFAFHAATVDPIPVLEEEEGGKLLLHRVEPIWPAGFAPPGTPIVVTLGVSQKGECSGVVGIQTDEENRHRGVLAPARLAMILSPLNLALKQWKFQPYVRDGKPTEFQVRFTFHVN